MSIFWPGNTLQKAKNMSRFKECVCLSIRFKCPESKSKINLSVISSTTAFEVSWELTNFCWIASHFQILWVELSNNETFFYNFVNIIFSSGEKKNDVFREVVFKYKHIAALFAYLDKKYASRQQQSGKKVVKYFVKLALCRVCVCTRKSSMRSFILEKWLATIRLVFKIQKCGWKLVTIWIAQAHTTSFKKIHFIVVKCIFSKRPVLLSPRPFCLLKHTKFIKAIVVVVEMREGGY